MHKTLSYALRFIHNQWKISFININSPLHLLLQSLKIFQFSYCKAYFTINFIYILLSELQKAKFYFFSLKKQVYTIISYFLKTVFNWLSLTHLIQISKIITHINTS